MGGMQGIKIANPLYMSRDLANLNAKKLLIPYVLNMSRVINI